MPRPDHLALGATAASSAKCSESSEWVYGFDRNDRSDSVGIRNLELVPQQQVLDHKVVPVAKEPGQCGEEEAD
jgi:hypothetical protein